MALPESLRETVLKIAWKCYGLPYIWGGDDAISGFDCSGFIVELLQSVGILPNGDWTADGLWNRFSTVRVESPHPGCLVFWQYAESLRIRHVELCIGSDLSMGASGGGSRTKDIEDAIAQNAFIKVRPIGGRGVVAGYVDPFRDLEI